MRSISLAIAVRFLLFFCIGFALTGASLLPVRAQQGSAEADLCAYGMEAVLDRFEKERKEFEPTIDALANKPTVATEALVGLGSENLRQYRARLERICTDAERYNRQDTALDCAKKGNDLYERETRDCWRYVRFETDYQRAVFEQIMLLDVAKKKILYLTTKYKELNKKFSSLLDLVIGVHDEMVILNKKIGEFVAEMCETGR